jgi:hypothetical protein
MKTPLFLRISTVMTAIAFALLLFACNVDVKKSADGKDKNVQIDTPVARLHVSEDANASETGLPVYPGAHVTRKEDNGNNDNANLNILTGFFGLKVVAVSYESDAPVENVKAYYKSQLKKYGNVLECRTSGPDASANYGDDSKSASLTCEQTSGDDLELKAGTRNNQHIVSIEPQQKGCKFSLVYVQIHGKETTI